MSISDLHLRLREAAVAYTQAGWPILPVETPAAERLICGRSPQDVATAQEWWTDQAYGIACYTGKAFDALEMPAQLGDRVRPMLSEHGHPGVIEVPRTGNWLFLVTPGARRIPDLPAGSGVRLHGKGRWILLPPTPVAGGCVAWICRPNGGLPHSMTAQWAARRALVIARGGPRRVS